MEESQLDKYIDKHFISFNIIYSILQATLYIIRGFKEEFITGIYIVAGLNLLFIPLGLIFKKKGFSLFYLIYGLILVYAISIDPSYLFNNFTALFIICIVIMIQPKLKNIAIILYFSAVCLAFLFSTESMILFFIHILRSVWFILIISYVLNNKFERKKLILYEDEIKILEQLSSGKIYQKEVQGFSENTIYRKLKAARERNGNITREQLIQLYIQQKNEKSDKSSDD